MLLNSHVVHTLRSVAMVTKVILIFNLQDSSAKLKGETGGGCTCFLGCFFLYLSSKNDVHLMAHSWPMTLSLLWDMWVLTELIYTV